MTGHRAAYVAWGLCAVDVAVVIGLLSLGIDEPEPWGSIAGAFFILVFATTGAVVATRAPTNPVGWLLCLAALAFTVGGLSVEVSAAAAGGEYDGPLVTTAAVVGTFVWILGFGPAATFLLLLFPDGRLPSTRWRPVAWLSGLAIGMSVVGLTTAPGPIQDTDVINPLGWPSAAAVPSALQAVGLGALLVCVPLSCASLVARYRSASTTQRQQLKWLAWSLPMVLAWLAASLVVGTQSGDTAVDIANALSSVGLSVVPIAIAVAITRHRLYDIDVVIKRTLVYSMLTAVLVATYLLLVLTLQTLLRPVAGDSDLAVAGSTLGVAALFRPLRATIQQGVDRRFFRSRYDAASTLTRFSDRLRHELDLDRLGADLRDVAQLTMQPEHVSLWLRSRP